MTGWIWIVAIVAVLLSAMFVRVNMYGSPQVKLLLKGLASLSFVVLGWLCAVKAGPSAYAVLMMIGLILGAVGDVLLQMMECRPEKREGFFVLGLGTFLVGHLMYILAFLCTFGFTIVQLLLAAILFGVLFALQYPARMRFGVQKIPVYIYAAIIAVMASCAIVSAVLSFSARSFLMLLGGVLFVVSDAVLALMFFSPFQSRLLPTANLITYYAAQILLALSIVAG